MHTVLPEIARVLEVHSVFLFLADRQGNLISKGSFGVVEEGETADELTGLCRRVYETAMHHEESVFYRNLPEELPQLSPTFRRFELQSVAAIPMDSTHQREGIILLCSTTPQEFRKSVKFPKTVADSLATAIENADLYQQIKIHASVLEQWVAERTAPLENANRELQAFSYSVSHDLKGPLRTVQGFSQALERSTRTLWMHRGGIT
ncbi:MAG: hypothetical protein GX443_00685 [Deltaproteobacteria bacterium]|nr:hypothetical protein [Deltaproteobacteria bacterium]